MMVARLLAIAVACLAATVAGVSAQAPTGNASVMFDHLPNRDTTELRARLFAEEKVDAGQHVRLTASGFVEGLVADQNGRVDDAIAEPQDVLVEFTANHLSLTAGVGRVVWGRLDELQPTDVVNPLDVSRFFFEGRSEARLAVPLVRASRKPRYALTDQSTRPAVRFTRAPPCPLAAVRLGERSSNGTRGARLNGEVGSSSRSKRPRRKNGTYTASTEPLSLA
jgi:hypothetical protein